MQGLLRRSALLLALGLLAAGNGSAAGGTIADYRLIVLDGASLKWGEPVDGTPATVTYAVVDAARRFPDARNCGGLSPVDRLLATNGVGRTTFDNELKAAFAAWSAVANIDFVPAPSLSAEILIGAQSEPRGRAFTNVDYDKSVKVAFSDGPMPPHQMRQALICLNPQERWKVGFDGNLEAYDLRYTLQHEIGHAIGLDHPSAKGVVMDFRYLEQFRTLQAGDIRGAEALYGARAGTAIAATGKAPPPVASSITELAISPPAQ
jgi:hypothetical protein